MIKLIDSYIEEAWRRIYAIRMACNLPIPISAHEVKKKVQSHYDYFSDGVFDHDQIGQNFLERDFNDVSDVDKFMYTFGLFYACVLKDCSPERFMVS